jgi:ribonuclease R
VDAPLTVPHKRKRPSPPSGLPSKQEILDYLRASPSPGTRQIARAFAVKGRERTALKALLAEMAEDGLLTGNRRGFTERARLPPVAVIDVVARDRDGDLIGEPCVWNSDDGPRPRVLVLGGRGQAAGPALGQGDRILARVKSLAEPDVAGCHYEAEPIKRLPRQERRMLGIFRAKAEGGGLIDPIDRKELRQWSVARGDEGGAEDGDLVRFDFEALARSSVPKARVLERLGNPLDQGKISLIAVHAHGIPDDFPAAVLREAAHLASFRADGRADLTGLALVTIDPADARDHDDAVHAARDPDPANPDGFVVHVAIADVAHYVRPGTRLDREAQLRGNSVYFPDRVVPMLPEKISNDLCSLKENEVRPCLAVRMVFDHHGNKRSHIFLRGMMRSAARLSYQEAQAAIDGRASARAAPLLGSVLAPLWAAYAVLAKARDRRAPLDLDVPERRIELDGSGRVARVSLPERLEAHRLIEAFMIAANVAAAEALEMRRVPLIYRVHEAPAKEKLDSLRQFLDGLDLRLPGSSSLRAGDFNRVLERAKSLPVCDLVNEIVLRAQSQAAYAADNIGHFGLNLTRYTHFTSPIRRYADLLVHRALIAALGADGAAAARIPQRQDGARLADLAQQVSVCERRAMAAERETADRLVAAFLSQSVGAEFSARVSGVTKSGLFVRLLDTGADGFVPAATIGGDFRLLEREHALAGRSGETYRLGDEVRVRLIEAIATAGALRFEMLSPGVRRTGGAAAAGRRSAGQRRRFRR